MTDVSLSRCTRATLTLRYRRLVKIALEDIERWLGVCRTPVVSVSGGKDSTVLLHLVRSVRSDVPAIRADPPNPLPGREEHVRLLAESAGGTWHRITYPWDVDAVLRGEVKYPENLKIRVLQGLHKSLGVDGVALGIRAAESKQRRLVLSSRGTVYQLKDDSWRCCPLAWWTAEEVLGYLLACGLPINPVYERTRRMPDGNLEHLRDGTWWPHGLYPEQMRPWYELHYPDVVPLFDAAMRVGKSRLVDP